MTIYSKRIPWREEPAGPQSMGLQRVRYDRVPNTFTFFKHFLSMRGNQKCFLPKQYPPKCSHLQQNFLVDCNQQSLLSYHLYSSLSYIIKTLLVGEANACLKYTKLNKGNHRKKKGKQGNPGKTIQSCGTHRKCSLRINIKPRKLRLLISNLFIQKIYIEVKLHDGLLL